MSKTVMLFAASAMALATAMPVSAQDTLDADTVVATVNGSEITLGHMLMMRAGLPNEYQQLPTDTLWEGLLEQMIRQEAMSQDTQARETRRVIYGVDNERRALVASEVVNTVAETSLTEDAVLAAYQERYEGVSSGTEYNASHILVETEDEAKALVQRLFEGADFAELARTESTGPSGPNGGSLGWFGPGMMVAPFQAAVETLEPGAYSDPVQTQFGWHVILLNETRLKSAPSLEEVRAELELAIQQQAVEAYIETVLQEADITRTPVSDVDSAVLNDLDLLGD